MAATAHRFLGANMPEATVQLEPYIVPFTILVDSAESQQFTFTGFRADANKDGRPLIVPTKWQPLGRHPHSLGDYSIEGMAGRVAVERKSMEDAWGTILGWPSKHEQQHELGSRRQRFEKELDNLAKIDAALVVVEATMSDCLRLMPAHGVKSRALNAKIFYRSVIAYLQDYRVPWLFCDSRRMAEVATYRFLVRFWEKHHKELSANGYPNGETSGS